jgi:uncharacterized membrane protein
MKISGTPAVKFIQDRMQGYLRLIFTLDVLIPILALSVSLGIAGSMRYPRISWAGTIALGIIIVMVHIEIIGAAMAGRAYREILSPRILSWWELGGVIVAGIGIPIGVFASYRSWGPIGVWILGSGLLFSWHWLSLRAGRQVLILRETVGAVLLVPLPLLFAWAAYFENFFPDREIGLAMLVFGLLALGANLGRAWSETEKPEPASGSFFGKATFIIAIYIFSFLLVLVGIQERIFLPPRVLYLKYGCAIAYVLGLALYYLGLRNMFSETAEKKLTRYTLYGVLIILFIVFWLAYRGRGTALM